eukprot:4943858-Prymnesium_polylepis.1
MFRFAPRRKRVAVSRMLADVCAGLECTLPLCAYSCPADPSPPTLRRKYFGLALGGRSFQNETARRVAIARAQDGHHQGWRHRQLPRRVTESCTGHIPAG